MNTVFLHAAFTLISIGLAFAGPAHGALTPTRLRCEYLEDPLAVQTARPRLSWALESGGRDQLQTAFQIQGASTPEALRAGDALLWDTGRVGSDESVHVLYAGKPLTSRQRVFWRIRAWDREGRVSGWSRVAFWQVGLLEPADWQAHWISVTNEPAPAGRPNFGFHSQLVRTADTNQWVVLDLGEPRRFDAIRLHPAHPQPWDPADQDFLFPRRFRVETADDAGFTQFGVVADRTAADVAAPQGNPVEVGFDPVHARFVRLHVTRLAARGGRWHGFALSELQVLDGGRNVALQAAARSSGAFRNGTWSETNLVDGVVVSERGGPDAPLPAPMLRTVFHLGERPRRAVLYATALGLYELRLNGRRVGDRLLAPEWTDYHTRIQYQAYDVTLHLRRGDNVLGALLGEGWYAGRIGMADWMVQKFSRVYGEKPWLLAQLEIEREDGTRQVIATGPDWRATLDGPIRQNDLLEGETHDARRALPGWDAPGGQPDASETVWRPVAVRDSMPGRLVAQPNEPVRVVEERPPVALTEPQPGVFIFDFGQNLVGTCRFSCRGPAGSEIRLRFAEMLNEEGTLYISNLRGAPQVDRFILSGAGREAFEPRFTSHGFRYVELTGLQRRPGRRDLTALVMHSAAADTGAFECSDARLNRLWENIRWTQRGNLVAVPTDCPQRDERLGWMGDIQAFSQTAIFNMDLGAFLTKWIQDIRDAQADDGRFPDFAPHPFGPNQHFAGAPGWADGGVIIPWRAYVNYADRRLLEQHYPSARRWVDYVCAHNPDGIWRTNRGNDYNDWLNGDTICQAGWPEKGAAIPKEVFATAFHAHAADLVSRMATVLGDDAGAKAYAALFANIKAAFNRAFVQPDGRIEGDTQAGYALALNFDLLPENLRPQAAGHLVEGVTRYDGHLSTGIQTTHRLLLELVRHGHPAVAWQLMTNRTFPSWLFTVDQGATTIWERWDGWVPDRGFQDRGMNSFNHWALGSVGEWMMRYIVGIQPDEAHPGYKHFVIRPLPGGGVRWARGSYDSIRGRIACDWRRMSDGGLELTVRVPANTTATVWLPTTDPSLVRVNGRTLSRAQGVSVNRLTETAVALSVGSGKHRLTTRGSIGDRGIDSAVHHANMPP